jgi:hypothetical protein
VTPIAIMTRSGRTIRSYGPSPNTRNTLRAIGCLVVKRGAVEGSTAGMWDCSLRTRIVVLTVAAIFVAVLVAGASPSLVGEAAAQTTTPGSAFTLTILAGSNEIRLSWQPGAVSGYTLTRITPDGALVLPPPGPTGSTALDTLPPGVPWACYQLQTHIGGGGSGSNLLCGAPSLAVGSAPGSVTIRLIYTRVCTPGPCIDVIADSAVVSWPPLPGAQSYVLTALGSGSMERHLGSSTTIIDYFADDVTGQPVQMSCYVVSVLGASGQVAGSSGPVCGMPQLGAPR